MRESLTAFGMYGESMEKKLLPPSDEGGGFANGEPGGRDNDTLQ